MKQNIQNFRLIIHLKRMILFVGIVSIMILSTIFSQAQIVPGNFEFEGEDRTYLVYLPDSFTGTEAFPLVICLHPYGWDGQQGMEYTNFNQVADTSDFLVAYPDAIPNWNSGLEDPNSPVPNVNDVGFIDALIDTLNYNYSIDLDKVYVCGFSNGGHMSYKLACELGHRFAAIASVSGILTNSAASNCDPSNTMPILHVHGTADAIVPINGDPYRLSVDSTLSFWISFNNCLEVDTIALPDIDPTDGCTVEKISYTNCTDNSNIIYYKVINGGHTWPGAGPSGLPLGNTNQDINASVEIWNFFKDYPPGHCLPEGITFTTQEEIDNFQTNYPGCTEIEGDVLIGTYWPDTTDITNLNGLSDLTAIDGDLKIINNDSLNDLWGLHNVTSIGEDMVIGDGVWFFATPLNLGNPLLTNLNGLDNLTSIGGNLEVHCNDSLTSLAGMENLTSIGGSLKIGMTVVNNNGSVIYCGNSSLASLTGLENVNYIGNDISIIWNNSLCSCEVQSLCEYLSAPNGIVYIHHNAPGCNNPQEIANACGITMPCLPFGNYYFHTQADVDSFQDNYPGCTQLEGNVQIMGDDITNLSGLNVITGIDGYLGIGYNPILIDLSGLNNLAFIGGGCNINNNESLISLSGLNLTSFGYSLNILNNESLTNLSGLENITFFEGNLGIGNNNSLNNLMGLDNMTGIDGYLSISYNNALNDFMGLGNLTSIGGSLGIYNNTSITCLSGLDNLINIGDDLSIQNNDSLISLNGMNSLVSIGGEFHLMHNSSLPNLIGLESLTSIGGTIYVFSTLLTSFTGLENLTSIGGYMDIRFNDALISLSGLDNIEPDSIHTLQIKYNPSLCECHVQSICEFLDDQIGFVHIGSNAPGCNNQQEVMDSCLITSVNEIRLEETFTISPNPLKSSSLIKYNIRYKSPVTIKIFDLTGQEIITLVDDLQQQGEQQLIFNTGGLPAGIYFCVLKTNNGMQTKKMIKL